LCWPAPIFIVLASPNFHCVCRPQFLLCWQAPIFIVLALAKDYNGNIIISEKEPFKMPFYDLHCPMCDSEFNILASMADKSEKRIPCPECGSFDLKTVYKGAPAHIKGIKEPHCPNQRACGPGGCHRAG